MTLVHRCSSQDRQSSGTPHAHGGWHPRYARVLAAASDGDYGFAVVDGNGDGAELEAEMWQWDSGNWHDAGSSGAGPLSGLDALRTGGQIDDACFAYGRAPGRQSVTISFDGQRHDVPVSRHGVWAFIKVRTDPRPPGTAFPDDLTRTWGHPPESTRD